MLSQSLKNAQGITHNVRGLSREQVNSICDNNSSIYNAIISEHFDGQPASCNFNSNFWVFADSIDDVLTIKEKAIKYGYKNMHTINPHITDKFGNRLSDPNGVYAVVINESDSLIFGELAPKFLNLLSPILDVFNNDIIFTYCHSGRATFKLNDNSKAELLKVALTDFLKIGVKEIGYFFSVEVDAHCGSLDAWDVNVSLTSSPTI